mgnify:CR=1 FL=1
MNKFWLEPIIIRSNVCFNIEVKPFYFFGYFSDEAAY